MLLTFCTVNFAGCQKAEVRTVEVTASANCQVNCFSVTRAFMDEHTHLLAENIRLKAKDCR